jgi:hypothetical protein
MSRTRRGRGLAGWLLLAAIAACPPPVASAQTPAATTGEIRGIVRHASTDAPLGRARVIAAGVVLPEPRVTITGADGRYTLADLPPGAYTVSVTRTGFAPQTWGQGRSITGTPVAVAAGQPVTAIDFALVPGGSIVGRILDEDGTPFAGALVDALVARFEGGAETLFAVASAESDDRGEFRLFGLAPGSYYVSAADPAFRNVSTPAGVASYAPTYYPGVAADQARPVTVTGPGDAPKIEFRLKLVPPSRVSGQLVAFDSRPLLNAAIIMSPLDADGVPMAAPEHPSLLPDGRFSFGGVAPGRYQIRARGQTDPAGAALFGVHPFESQGADVEGVKITLRPGATLEGTLKVESRRGAARPPLPSLRVRAPFVDGNSFGDSLTGTVQPDGSFALRGIMKGTHQIVVDGLQAPWVVRSVVYQGAAITDLPIEASEKQAFRDVRITITDESASVEGVVLGPRDAPAANAGVLLFARVPLYWMRTNRRMRIAYTDQDGRFTIGGLPAGEYLAVASAAVDEGDLGRRDRLRAWEPLATVVRLDSDAARADVRLRLAAPPSRQPAPIR